MQFSDLAGVLSFAVAFVAVSLWAIEPGARASRMSGLARALAGWRTTSTPGSNTRRLLGRVTLALIVYLCLDVAVESDALSPSGLGVWTPAIWSLVYFVFAVLVIPFLTSERFWPNPIRLATDTVTSIALSILGFSLIYREFGLTPDCATDLPDTVYVYFSAVTFSTLGYGDFSPCPDVYLVAAGQAILGNLHLGLIVGTAFFATDRRRQSADDHADSEHNQQDRTNGNN